MHSPVCGTASGSSLEAHRAHEERRSSNATPAEPPETTPGTTHPAQPKIAHACAPCRSRCLPGGWQRSDVRRGGSPDGRRRHQRDEIALLRSRRRRGRASR
eukprot:2867172-Prymnesium_polylepis.3